MAVLPDPLTSGQIMLVVGGSTGSDDIRIRTDEYDADSIRVRINEKDVGHVKIRGNFSTPLSRIVVYGPQRGARMHGRVHHVRRSRARKQDGLELPRALHRRVQL